MLFAGPLAGIVGRRFGSKWPLAGGMLIVSFAALAVRGRARRAAGTVLVASALLGLGVGAAFAAMAALIADNVDALEMGVASGMNTVVRMIGAVDRRPGRRGAPDRADDRLDLDPRRVRLHDGLRAQRGRGARRRGRRGLDRHAAAPQRPRARPRPLALTSRRGRRRRRDPGARLPDREAAHDARPVPALAERAPARLQPGDEPRSGRRLRRGDDPRCDRQALAHGAGCGSRAAPAAASPSTGTCSTRRSAASRPRSRCSRC